MSGAQDNVIVLDAPATNDAGDGAEVQEASRVTAHDDGKKTFTLECPVKLRVKVNGGPETEKTYTSITMRRPTGDDILVMMNFKNEADQLRQLFTRLTGEPVAVLNKMDVNDFVFTQEVIESFLPNSLKTGKATSAP